MIGLMLGLNPLKVGSGWIIIMIINAISNYVACLNPLKVGSGWIIKIIIKKFGDNPQMS